MPYLFEEGDEETDEERGSGDKVTLDERGTYILDKSFETE